jgi:hypothetical protein
LEVSEESRHDERPREKDTISLMGMAMKAQEPRMRYGNNGLGTAPKAQEP